MIATSAATYFLTAVNFGGFMFVVGVLGNVIAAALINPVPPEELTEDKLGPFGWLNTEMVRRIPPYLWRIGLPVLIVGGIGWLFTR